MDIGPPVISQHNSWISVDPVQGCLANCCYCFLQPLDLTSRQPRRLLSSPEEVYRLLQGYSMYDKGIFEHAPPVGTTPIAIGNYTDMCMSSKNRDYLLSLLSVHRQLMPDIPVCILTKAVLSRRFLEAVARSGVRAVFFVSHSSLPSEFEKGTPPCKQRLKNFELIAEFPDLMAVHWWRPITSISIPDRDAAKRQIEDLQRAGSQLSVAVGLKYGVGLNAAFGDPQSPLHTYFKANSGNSKCMIFEEEILRGILDNARNMGYPVFRKSFCALSYLLKQPCYGAGFRKLRKTAICDTSNCPSSQENKCLEFAQKYTGPSRKLIDEIAEFLGLSSRYIVFSEATESIVVRAELSQERQNFLTQATGYPVVTSDLLQTQEWAEEWRTDIENGTP
jgi:hypothetical protein